MSDDLVKILRADDGDWRTDQAADRIEELEGHLARYRALYEAARHDAQEAEAYAEALEAKLYDIAQEELKGQDQ